MPQFKYQGLKNNSSKILLTLHPPINLLHRLTLDADGGKKIASLADTPIIPLFRRIAAADIVLSTGPDYAGSRQSRFGMLPFGDFDTTLPDDGWGVAAVQETY
jgi:hypothetical protein